MDNVAQCVSYVPCEILDLLDPSVQVPLAPANLTNVCDAEVVSSDKTPCVEACDPAACCYSLDDDSCLQDNFLACASYTSCVNLLPIS